MEKADIGVIGLAVMGQNLVLNMADSNFQVAVFNRTYKTTDAFINGPAKGKQIIGTRTTEGLIAILRRPRIVMLMVRAGHIVDTVIESLTPYLEPGDIIIDGGNSLHTDTQRRCQILEQQQLLFIGTGVSGGEEGARHGPSIMPGGSAEAWPRAQPILQAISAQVDGEPCCQWVGQEGAGHYVKMVHNGIEYGDMQLICEAYQLLREGLGLDIDKVQETFEMWNRGVLESYLIEITSNILAHKTEEGAPLIDEILDTAGQKGTGKWTGINALELGVPLTLIGEAVFARCLSSMKTERVIANKVLGDEKVKYKGEIEPLVQAIHDALYASKIISYAQGFMLMREAAGEYAWDLNYGGIALMWRGGCIIRSKFLNNIKNAFDKNPGLTNLLLDDYFSTAIKTNDLGWRRAVSLGIELAIPTPAFSAALSFYDGYRSARLPANLLQAQRDYFGAHTYEKLNQPGKHVHTDWTGTGGDVHSSTYDV